MQFEIFPDQIRLRREDASQNMRRFYRMVVNGTCSEARL